MKHLAKLLDGLREAYNKSAPGVLTVFYGLALFIILYGAFSGEREVGMAAGGCLAVLAVIQLLTAAGLLCPLSRYFIGMPSYDTELIKKYFPFYQWNRVYDAVSMIHHGEDSEALELLGELKDSAGGELSVAAVGFYQAICYNRMGYPTNAGRCAAEAADKGICLPESMLMAARNFYMAGSLSQAREYYEKLLPLSDENRVYPFVYNELGRVYLSSDMGEEAEKAFGKSLEIGFSPTVAEGGLALACLLQKRFDEAGDWYRLALMSRIEDDDGFKEFAAQVCRACGLEEDFLDVHLRKKYGSLKKEA